jgi:hypothetical protein
VDGDGGPAYGRDFVSTGGAIFALFSLGAKGAFVVPFPLTEETEILG